MTTQIVISSLKDSHNQDDTLILLEFQGTLEYDQDDIRGLTVGDLEENDQVSFRRVNFRMLSSQQLMCWIGYYRARCF
jgi:hypothetical protein